MKWKKETRKISELKANDRNPRSLSEKSCRELDESIKRFGLCQPIQINTDGQIIGGHQRLSVLKQQGETQVDVYVPEESLSKEEEEELSIRLNKNMGDWDFDLLANNYDITALIEWGFSEKELGFDGFDDEEKKEKPSNEKSKVGDVYDLGTHQLICGKHAVKECDKLVSAWVKMQSYKLKPDLVVKNGNIIDWS